MKRSIIQKIVDRLSYDRKAYKEYTLKNNIYPPKYLFTDRYKKITLYKPLHNMDEKHNDIIKNLMAYDESSILKLLSIAKDSQYEVLYSYKDDLSMLLNDEITSLFPLKSEYISPKFIEDVMKNNLEDEYTSYKQIFSLNEAMVIFENCNYDKIFISLLPKDPIIKNIKDYSSLKHIMEYKNFDILVINYLSDNRFANFINNVLNSRMDIADEILTSIKDKDYDIDRLEKMLEITYKIYESDKSSLFKYFLKGMIENDEYYASMLKVCSDDFGRIYKIREVFRYGQLEDKELQNMIGFMNDKSNNLVDLKNIYNLSYPFDMALLSIPYNEITDDIIKFYYEQAKQIKESDNVEYIKKVISNFNKSSIKEHNLYVQSFLAKYNFNNIQNKMLSKDQIKQLNSTMVEYDGKKIPVYKLEGTNFHLMVHVVQDWVSRAKEDENEHTELYYARNLVSSPDLWKGKEGVKGSETLSLSTIKETRPATFFGVLMNGNNNDIILGFDTLPYEQVMSLNSVDAGAERGSYNQREFRPYQLDRIINGSESFDSRIGGGLFSYNEMTVFRKTPNGQTILPSYVITTKNLDDPSSEQVKKWAAYYDIPIIYIDKQKYKDRFIAERDYYYSNLMENKAVLTPNIFIELDNKFKLVNGWDSSDSTPYFENTMYIYNLAMNVLVNASIENVQNLLSIKTTDNKNIFMYLRERLEGNSSLIFFGDKIKLMRENINRTEALCNSILLSQNNMIDIENIETPVAVL